MHRDRRRSNPERSAPSARALLFFVWTFAVACSGEDGLGPTDGDGVSLPGGSSLVFQGEAAVSTQRSRIEGIVRQTIEEARARIPLDRITVTIRFGSGVGVIPQLGFGGRADAGTVFILIDPDAPEWLASRDTELRRILFHELHHVARFRAVGFNRNLLEALVTEGLADQFMVEASGGGPPIWATALEGDDLEAWLAVARQTWHQAGYDHPAWFFPGVSATIPAWAGYAIGFEITGRFLETHPGELASTLVDRPAVDLVPPE